MSPNRLTRKKLSTPVLTKKASEIVKAISPMTYAARSYSSLL